MTPIIIPGEPVAKPRQTKRDIWKPRPRVLKYRAWADKARAFCVGRVPDDPERLVVVAYLPIPKSWTGKKKLAMRGQPHRQVPDSDNIIKAVCDALWKQDSGIWDEHIQKFWDDGQGPRCVIVEVQ